MEIPLKDPAGEIKRLQRWIDDLIGVASLPAIWAGGEPSQILSTLLDRLLEILRLDLAFVRLNDSMGGGPIEMVRGQSRETTAPQEIGEMLSRRLGDDPREWPSVARTPIGAGDISIVPLPLGLQGEAGLIVAGSRRVDFPDQTERLVLSVAVNQAAIGLQEAQLRCKQRRVTKELDQRVVQRTRELAAANEDLRKEIAERKRAEEALRRTEARLADRERDLQFFPALLGTYRPDGTRSFVNRTWQEYLGLTFEEGTGASARTFPHFHPADADLHDKLWRASLANGQPLSIEVRVRRADGQYRWHTSRRVPLHDEQGRVVKWYSVGIDIEDQKVAEEALRRSEEKLRRSEARFRDYAEAASDWLWETGSDHRFTWFSLPTTSVQHPSTQIGRGRWEIAADVEKEPQKWRRHIATLDAHEPFRGFTYQMVQGDGSIAYLSVSGKPVFDADGGFQGYRGVASDVTAAVRAEQAEQALHQARIELAHVLRVTTLGELAASIAHEINQPLSGIITNANTCLRMLAADAPNVEGARETARRSLRDANRASDVIVRLRALFSKKEPVLDSLDLNEATREVVALSLSELERSEVILRAELADDLPLVSGDRVQVQQVILNLVLNAVDAMSGVNDRPRELMVRTERDEGKGVRLSVRDAGVGLEPQGVEKLFEPFYTTKRGGMGIGLSVSRSIIESHHGRLWAAPNEGPGATFAFTIPCGLSAARP